MSDTTSTATQNLDFDDETLRAIAEVYSNEGDNECSKGEYHQAIDSYTEGIKVNCKDENLKAKLFTNRATVHYHLGNYSESLRDAKVARQFQPTYTEAIIRGALACVRLNLIEDAIKLCDEGLATDKENKTLLELRSMSLKTENTSAKKFKTKSETGAIEDKDDHNKTLLKTEQSIQEEEILEKKVKATESFDDDKLKAKAEEYKNLGNDEFSKNKYATARDLYTEGMKVNCKDQELNAKLYNNRATAQFYLGNYFDSLNDAKAAIQIQPAYMKAIERGAKACVKLKLFQDAIVWCDQGLKVRVQLNFEKIEMENKTLFQLKEMSLGSDITRENKEKNNTGTMEGKHLQENNKQTEVKMHHALDDFQNAIEYNHLKLSIAKRVGDRAEEGRAYSNLGYAYHSLADFKRATEYHQLHLRISKELGDTAGEGNAYCSLGNAYTSLGDFKKALECHELHLGIAKEEGGKAREGVAYSNLGNTHYHLGDFKTAMKYHHQHLNIVKELGFRAEIGHAYNCLGAVYCALGDFQTSIKYQQLHLSLVSEDEDRTGQLRAYNNLGNVYIKLGDFRKAIEFYQLALCIAKEVNDRELEGMAYNNLGNCYSSLGDLNKAKVYHQLSLLVAKQLKNRAREGAGYTNLGIDYSRSDDSQNALEYHQLALGIAKEVGDVTGEGIAYSNLGNVYKAKSDFKRAIEYHHLHLNIVKAQGDKHGEASAYNNLGNAFNSLGDFREAIKYFQLCIDIAKNVGDRAKEGRAKGNLGLPLFNRGKYEEAIKYYREELEIAKEVGDRAEEGRAYGNLGMAYSSLGNFPKALENHDLHLSIANEVGDKAGARRAYNNLGQLYNSLRDPKKALEYLNLAVRMDEEAGDKFGEGISYLNSGIAHACLGDFCRAEICFKSSVRLFDHARSLLSSNDEWKISLQNRYQKTYKYLLMVLLQQNKTDEALLTAERGRAQALKDLMESRYSLRSSQSDHVKKQEEVSDFSSCISSPTVFLAVDNSAVNFWLLQEGRPYAPRWRKRTRRRRRQKDSKWYFLRKEIDKKYLKTDAIATLATLNENAYSKIGVLEGVQCEDRSFGEPTDELLPLQMSDKKEPTPEDFEEDPLKLLYDILVSPVVDLLHGGDVTIVPDGPLFLAPFAAFKDQNSSYLSEKFTLRIIPTLATLNIMAELSERHQSTSGVLLVGDPCLRSIRIQGKTPNQLPNGKKEVEMIGKILKTVPLTDEKATKAEVLSRLSSVALVHIAAHGKAETGEILLSPNPTTYKRPKEKDYLLTMEDVKNAKLNAQLVVLSCCHSGRGDIKAEGVVGIARAFLGAGARSVVASLWAIDDEATLTFMEYFYKQLVEERQRASKSLNQAMKLMRESENFSEVKLWAPFVLIGDDVSLDLEKTLTSESQPSADESST